MLTDEQIKKYVKNDGSKCPYCGSDQLEGNDYDYEGGQITQNINCLDCKKSWVDFYGLNWLYENESVS